MKVAIAYPPLQSDKGTPLLSQNRQFQWFSNPTYIYPVIPAYAATMLQDNGFEVFWSDGIASQQNFEEWFSQLKKIKPDLVFLETKTPVIKRHWKIIAKLKKELQCLVALAGDHVTALPEESFEKSTVDFVLTGGDYDFLLLNLAQYLAKKEKLEPGIWYRNKKREAVSTGSFSLSHNLNTLPLINRDLTQWKRYAYKNGNFKYTPGAYIMSGRDCWWRKNGGCTFCSWTTLYPQFRVRSVESVLDEIGHVIENYGVKEVMDDTGTFMTGKWLQDFCKGMIKRGYNHKVTFSCNMRFGALSAKDYELMAKAGFRFLLYGLESANQHTVDQLNKGTNVSQVEKELELIKSINEKSDGSLEPHITCMVGYPWESKKEAKTTIETVKSYFKKGLISTLQATIVIPYPGTTLFKQCQEKGTLTTTDWDRYDMSAPVMKTSIAKEELRHLTRGLYTSVVTPEVIFKKVLSIRRIEDFSYLFRAGVKWLGHFFDFS